MTDLTKQKVSGGNTLRNCHQAFSNLGLTDIHVEQAHRTGPRNRDRWRTIVVRLLLYEHRKRILTAAKEWKPKGLYFNEDFSVRVSATHKNLRPQIKKLCSQGKPAYISFDLKKETRLVQHHTNGRDNQDTATWIAIQMTLSRHMDRTAHNTAPTWTATSQHQWRNKE